MLPFSQVRRDRIPEARKALVSHIDRSGVRALIEAVVALGGHPYLFAGAVRDTLFQIEHGDNERHLRDLDIGVHGLSIEQFRTISLKFGGRRNRYDGYALRFSTYPVDLWRLENTCGLRLTGAAYSLSAVLRSFVLNANAIAFDLCDYSFFDLGAIEAVQSRTLDFVAEAILHSAATFSAKAVLLSARTSMNLSRELRSFVTQTLHAPTFDYEARKVSPWRPVDCGSPKHRNEVSYLARTSN